MQQICPGLTCVPTVFVNAYFIGNPDDRWAVVDTGLPGFAARIIEKAARRFGRKSRPTAVFLTHGHFDHAGNARALADHWGVPVYVHRLEMPYLTGRSDYPPPDPTVGGAIAAMSRVMPHGARDLGTRLRALPGDPSAWSGDLPEMDGWRWLHTPGHSPGHVAFHHPADGILLAGDAVATVDMNSYVALATQRQEIATGGAPFICDWQQYAASVRRLADLAPTSLACGHGLPLKGGEVAGDLAAFAKDFMPPKHGRYVDGPAETDERGVDALPPKPFDPFPYLLGAGIAGLIAAFALTPRRKR